MADSPAKRHLSRVLAAQESARMQDGMPAADTPEHDLQLLRLADYRGRLKQIQSQQGKAALKLTLVPDFDPYLQGVLEADAGGPNEVFTTVMLWNIDAGRFDRALDLAEYALKHKLKMPDRFERATGNVVAEEVAEAALVALRDEASTFDTSILGRTISITAAEDMPDQARAKLHLAAGRHSMRALHGMDPPPLDQLQDAVANFTLALQLNKNCGGVKDLERAQRLLKNHAGPEGITPPNPGTAPDEGKGDAGTDDTSGSGESNGDS